MKSLVKGWFKFAAMASAAGMMITTPASAAPVLWTLQNISFTDGGSLTGSFVHDSDLAATDAVLSLSVTASGGDESIFAPLTYTKSNSLARMANFVGSPTLFVQSNTDFFEGRARQLRLSFVSPLTNLFQTINVDDLASFAAECYNCGPRRRFMPGGSIVGSAVPLAPVPEPATWSLMIMGFGLTGALLRRRRTSFVSPA